MKMSEALRIIKAGAEGGFLVKFNYVESGCIERSDYFPDTHNGEQPIATEEEAWELASMFAKSAPVKFYNIYVTNSIDFRPVPDYNERMLRRKGR